MKPEPLASSGTSDWSWNGRSRSSMLGWPRPRWRFDAGLAKRSVSIDTTAGRAWSATASNAVSVSAADATCAGAGLVGDVTRDCAQLKRVRSKPDAKRSPQRNATTIAAAKPAREFLLLIEHTC